MSKNESALELVWIFEDGRYVGNQWREVQKKEETDSNEELPKAS